MHTRTPQAPRISREMHAIIARVQHRMGGWVGSSVVHLGDSNVPNALVFIDKVCRRGRGGSAHTHTHTHVRVPSPALPRAQYSQIQRILNPIVIVVRRLPLLCREKPGIGRYVEAEFGGADNAAREGLVCIAIDGIPSPEVVTRLTSSKVVMPSRTLRRPSSNNVCIPSASATFLIWPDGAFWMTRRWISSLFCRNS